MSLLAALVLAAGAARVESVALTTANTRLAGRVALSGQPGMVAVHREGGAARLSIMDARLGLRFAGGSRVAWAQGGGVAPPPLPAPPRPRRPGGGGVAPPHPPPRPPPQSRPPPRRSPPRRACRPCRLHPRRRRL